MKKFFNRDKLKSYSKVFFIYLIAQLVVGYIFLSEYREQIEEHTEESLRDRIQEYNSVHEELKNRVLTTLVNYFQKPEIISLMGEASRTDNKQRLKEIRDEILKKYSHLYDELQRDGMVNLHFHLPNTSSFLRFHRPTEFGDSLIDTRESVFKVNHNGNFVHGYEVGKIINAFRSVLPLYDTKGMIGSVEISYGEEKLLESLKSITGYDYIFLVKNNLIERKMFKEDQEAYMKTAISEEYNYLKTETSHNKLDFEDISYLLKDNLGKKLEGFESFIEHINSNNKIIELVFIPIENISKDLVGYLVSYKIDKHYIDISNKYILGFSISSFALMMLFLFFTYRTQKINELVLKHKYFDTVFNTQEDIVLLTEGTFLSEANSSFFNFLGFKSLDDFHKVHNCICEFFEVVEKEDYIYENKNGKNWLHTILENPEIKFKCIIIINGRKHTFSIRATYLHFDERDRSLVVLSDITELIDYQTNLEDKIRERTKELNRHIHLVDENIIISSTDTKGVITYASEAFSKISGYKKTDLIGKRHNIIRHPDNPEHIYSDMWRTILKGGVWKGEIKNRNINGDAYWVEANIYPNFNSGGDIVGYTAIRQDITDKKIVEELSITDALTGLYNRRHFNNLIERELLKAKDRNSSISFIVMDIDNFKKYNDNYGHQKGDSVLKSVATLFKNSLSCQNGYAFRLGGEEFGAIFSQTTLEDAVEMTNFICQEIEKAGIVHYYNEDYGVITGSFGLCFVEKLTENINGDTMYRLADEALYRAKENGRNRVEVKIVEA